MDPRARVEKHLEKIVSLACVEGCPPKLAAAVRHAVFPGGARVRPLLCVGVAQACGDLRPVCTDAAAAAIELLHCASLVHDDMPCFDDADTRRGLPSVHRAFGEPIAVLTGDALIVLAFESLARSFAEAPQSLPALTSILSRAVGMAGGLVAGQAWESELSPSIEAYHAAKTGSLFVAAAKAGAASARFEPLLWEEFGARLGEAYQVADDIRDKSSSAEALGKPVGRDAALGRPNAVAKLGMRGALGYLDDLVAGALKSVPDCPGADQLRDQVRKQLRWLVPVEAAQFAA